MAVLWADSGATKTTWKLISEDKKELRWLHTKGINPNYLSQIQITSILRAELLPTLGVSISAIRFYGAGCSQESAKKKLIFAFNELFPKAKLTIGTDLVGAYQAIAPKAPAWVCILGTGANACVIEKGEIRYQNLSLGYILGDEGSGQDIGKHLLKAYFLKQMPARLRQAWEATYSLSYTDFLEKVYQSSKPNVWMASFAPFAKAHIQDPFIERLVMSSLDNFIATFILPQKTFHHLNIHFVGSVAYHFSEQLQKVCTNHGLLLGEVIQHPIEYW